MGTREACESLCRNFQGTKRGAKNVLTFANTVELTIKADEMTGSSIEINLLLYSVGMMFYGLISTHIKLQRQEYLRACINTKMKLAEMFILIWIITPLRQTQLIVCMHQCITRLFEITCYAI